MRPSQLLAGLAFVFGVPGSLWLAYWGYWRGFYPYTAIPFAFGAAVVALTVALFGTLPLMRKAERRL